MSRLCSKVHQDLLSICLLSHHIPPRIEFSLTEGEGEKSKKEAAEEEVMVMMMVMVMIMKEEGERRRIS